MENPGIYIELMWSPILGLKGPDLLMALPLSYADLVLGTVVEIPHITMKFSKSRSPLGLCRNETISVYGEDFLVKGYI